jgi:hypothetical protein
LVERHYPDACDHHGGNEEIGWTQNVLNEALKVKGYRLNAVKGGHKFHTLLSLVEGRHIVFIDDPSNTSRRHCISVNNEKQLIFDSYNSCAIKLTKHNLKYECWGKNWTIKKLYEIVEHI